MALYAQVVDGAVWALVETDNDISTMYPPFMIWVNVDAFPGIQQRWIATNTGGVWTFAEPTITPEEIAQIAYSARLQRDGLLRSVCDVGVLMAQRAIRLAATPEEIAYAQGKIVELDAYALELLDVPEQAGFPLETVWPIAPTK